MMDKLVAPSRERRLRISAAACGTHDRWYARIKMKTDPAYDAVIRALQNSDLPMLDIGCGMGLLGFYLRAAGFRPPITGIDFDESKIAHGQEMGQRLGLADLHLSAGNALTDLPRFSGNVVILDILQYFTISERENVIRSAADRVAPGGKLIIRSGLKDHSWRFRLTAWTDKLAASAKWMKSQPQTYPAQSDFENPLNSLGFEVEIQQLWGKTPFNNYLIVATRQGPAIETSAHAPS